MKKLIVAAFVACAATTLFAKPFSSNKPYNEMTEEEKAVRRQEAMQNRLEHFGEKLVKPDSQKGRILFVDGRASGSDEEIKTVISNITKQLRFKIEIVKDSGDKTAPANAKKKMKSLGCDAAIFLVECDACDDMMLVAPESGWAIVNMTALLKGAKNDAFRAGRTRKQLTRAFYSIGGAMASRFPGSLMGTVCTVDDLDRVGEMAPVDIIQRTKESFEKRGITPEIISFYRRACEQGWAPAPTNDIQKAIWNDVHKLPSKPIQIKYDPKKGE